VSVVEEEAEEEELVPQEQVSRRSGRETHPLPIYKSFLFV